MEFFEIDCGKLPEITFNLVDKIAFIYLIC